MNKGNFMETNLIVEGFKFMGLGMGTVFLFLVVMIFSMNIMSTVVHRFFPEPEVNADAKPSAPKDNKNVIAAITAAVKYHREG